MNKPTNSFDAEAISRRNMLKLSTATLLTSLAGGILPRASMAKPLLRTAQSSAIRSPKAFVYTELPISIPFAQTSWKTINAGLLQQPGLLNMTWLVGLDNNSLGGLHAFDSIDNAQHFATVYFPSEARKLGTAQTSRIFDAAIAQEASQDIDSPYFGIVPVGNPGAFVYTEVQVNVPFDKAPWRKRNPVLKQQPGLLAKTWLSGLHTHTLGGLDVFDTVEHAQRFALNDFPKLAKRLNAAFYTRIFDARLAEEASRQMSSPFYI